MSLQVIVSRKERGIVEEWFNANLPHMPLFFRSGKKGAVKIISDNPVSVLLQPLEEYLRKHNIILSIWERKQ